MRFRKKQLLVNRPKRDTTRHAAARRDRTHVTRRYAMENKGMLLFAVHVWIGTRTRFHKSLCEVHEPRFGRSSVRYDRYVFIPVNRRVLLLSFSRVQRSIDPIT